jgi:hypothetical protein
MHNEVHGSSESGCLRGLEPEASLSDVAGNRNDGAWIRPYSAIGRRIDNCSVIPHERSAMIGQYDDCMPPLCESSANSLPVSPAAPVTRIRKEGLYVSWTFALTVDGSLTAGAGEREGCEFD